MKKTVWKPVLAAAAAGLMLSGCGSPGTAASIGDVQTRSSEFDKVRTECRDAGFSIAQNFNNDANALLMMTMNRAIEESGKLDKYMPEPAQIQDALKQTMTPEVLESEACSGLVESFFKFQSTTGAIAEAGDEEAMKVVQNLSQKLEINPRYGRVVETPEGSMLSSGSLSQAVDATLMGE